MNYRREIDGLRALAVIPVILFHAGFDTFSGGYVGVDVFFVISGYLITTIILAELQAEKFSIVGFYERRARRILPALFLVMATCIPFAWLLLRPETMVEFSRSLIAVSLFGSNIFFWRESNYFGTATDLKPLLHTWSLAVEEQFYLLFPLLLITAWRKARNRIVPLLVISAGASLTVAHWGVINSPVANFFLLPSRWWELAIGSITAFYFASSDRVLPRGSKSQFLSTVGLLMVVYSIFAFDQLTPYPSLYTLLPTVGTSLIILFAWPETFVGRLLSSKLLVGIGLVSYSAYLWHQPLFAFARHATLEPLNVWVAVCLSGIAFGLSYFSWRFVEKPFRRKGAYTRKTVFTLSVTFSTVFVGIGILGHHSQGFSYRFEAAALELSRSLRDRELDRRDAIRIATCHFNELFIDIDTFLDHWECRDDASMAHLKKIPLIITGDSHSADKVVSFKQNGYLPLQIGGAGCSLIPRLMTKECSLIFQKLYYEVQGDDFYQAIALSSRFGPQGLSLDSAAELIAYWKRFNKAIIIFDGMPEFNSFEDYLFRGRSPKVDFSTAPISSDRELRTLLERNGVYVIDTPNVFCSINDCRFFSVEGMALITDGNHLSVEGARHFGKALIESDPVIQRLIN